MADDALLPGTIIDLGNLTEDGLWRLVAGQILHAAQALSDGEAQVTVAELRAHLDAPGGGAVAWAEITGKPAYFPPQEHTHGTDAVVGLGAAALADTADFAAAAHTHGSADLPWFMPLLNDLQEQIDGIETGTGGSGTPGTPGQDGASAYLYLAYAEDGLGGGFSMIPQPGSAYIAARATGAEVADPQAADFAGLWMRFRGLDGQDGAQGPAGNDGAPGAPGADGANGEKGDPGEGVAPGGSTGQILAKKSGDDYDTEWVDAPTGGSSGGASAHEELTGVQGGAAGEQYHLSLAELEAVQALDSASALPADAFAPANHDHDAAYDALGAAAAVQDSLAAHTGGSNPHNITISVIGAAAESHTHGTSAINGLGTAALADVEDFASVSHTHGTATAETAGLMPALSGNVGDALDGTGAFSPRRRATASLAGLTGRFPGEVIAREAGDGDDDLYYWYATGNLWRKAGV